MSNLLKDMKLLNEDHTPEGFPAVRMSEINGLIEIIEKQSIQLAKANERVEKLEVEKEGYALRISKQKEVIKRYAVEAIEIAKAQEKFAIEQKIEAINEALDYYEELKASEEPIGAVNILHVCLGRLVSRQEQLRKEQK